MSDQILQTPAIVYAESTPNPATMKFVANRVLLIDNSVEYTAIADARGSELATELFRFPFVKSVYIANNFVTVTKQDTTDWYDVMNELREYIKHFLEEGRTPVGFVEHKPKPQPENISQELKGSTTEIETQIISILDEYIKPAVEQDGGEISFHSFKDGIVTVMLKGSCSGCPSSTLTLKAGIEELLKRMVPGVERVEAEND